MSFNDNFVIFRRGYPDTIFITNNQGNFAVSPRFRSPTFWKSRGSCKSPIQEIAIAHKSNVPMKGNSKFWLKESAEYMAH